MKKKGFGAICIATAMLVSCTAFFAGCGESENSAKEYTIQYSDDTGLHSLTVTDGMAFELETVPAKNGYTFMGLYDAEEGGTQFVSATGVSLSPFIQGKNMMLYPQFKAKEYTVILDYQGAEVTGERQLTVTYNASLPELPKNLTGEHKDFSGWYTQKNCEGTRVADAYGLIPIVSVFNETNFDLSAEYVTLYAGFETEKFTVTCFFEKGTESEDVQVEYNTPASRIVPRTRVNGEAPIVWSKSRNGEAFNGKITEDTVLYVVEYAPVIDFDSDGGSEVSSVIARAGTAVTLPTPTKEMAKFSHWEDASGNRFSSATMPQKSVTLKAVWQAKLVFDPNGGTSVDDISEPAGATIVLPIPEKEGFLFAGWYKADKEQYTSTVMPATGVKLKAGWYKAKTETTILVESTNSRYSKTRIPDTSSNLCFIVDFSAYMSEKKNTLIKIDWHAKIAFTYQDSNGLGKVDFYSTNQISSNNLLDTKTFKDITGSFKEVVFSTTFTISDNFYVCWYSTPQSGGSNPYFFVRDFYYTIHYPNSTELYL